MNNRRGYILMMFSWSIVALSLFMQVFMARGLTDLKTADLYRIEAESRQIAEGGLDSMLNFFMNTTDATCMDYEKPSFTAAGGCGASHDPCACDTAISNEISQITTGDMGLQAGIGAKNAADVAFQVKILGLGQTKTVYVKGYRDFTNSQPRAVAQVAAELSIHKQVSQGLIGIDHVRIGAFGNVLGDVATLSSGLGAIDIDRSAWIKGRVMIGPLPNGIDPNNYGSWIGNRSDTHRIVVGSFSGVMDDDPAPLTLQGRKDAITARGHGYHVVDDNKKSIVDIAHVVYDVRPSAELQVIMDELSQSPDTITAGMDCSTNIDLAQFQEVTLTTSSPAYSSSRKAFCFNSISMLKNSKLILNVAGGPMPVYIKGQIPSWPGQGIRMGEAATLKRQTAATPYFDGVQLKMASSYEARFFNDAILYGSLFAPQSIVHFGEFNDINGTAVLALELYVQKMADQGMPGNGGGATAVFSVGIKNWVERPNPE